MKQILQNRISSPTAKEYEFRNTPAIITRCDTESNLYGVLYVDNYGNQSNKSSVRCLPGINYTPSIGDIVNIAVSNNSLIILGKILESSVVEEKSRERKTEKDVQPDTPGHTMGNVGI